MVRMWKLLPGVILVLLCMCVLRPAAAEETAAEDTGFHVQVIRLTPAPTSAPHRVLIYHSHTYEAYAQTPDKPYHETEKWRSDDAKANVVAVGEALTAALAAYGVEVVHDTTAFEPPDLSGAYTRSLNMLQARRDRGEHYDLYIDLHRDAISATSTLLRTVRVGGVETARFMVLVGQGTAQGFSERPDWEANCAIAQRITDSLNRQAEQLCRDVKVKSGRFNQHIAPCCVLIECGNNYNTLDQVLCGVPYLAAAIVETLDAMTR